MERETAIELKDIYLSYRQKTVGADSLKGLAVSIFKKDIFKRKRVLQGLSLDVYKGECLGLMGPNGCGKSTMLRIASGLLKPDSGSVIIRGTMSPILAIGAGLEMELTGYDNIKLLGTLTGMSSKMIKEKTEQIIEFSELTESDLNMQVKGFSAGMRARLSFSINAVNDPEILIIDEALAVGDKNFRLKCQDRINKIKEEGATIVIVSHNIEEIERLSDRVAIIKDGIVKATGKFNEVYNLY